MIRRAHSAAAVIAMLLCLTTVSEVVAHNRSQSHSSWNVMGNTVDMVFTVQAREVTRLVPLGRGLLTLEALLSSHIGETTVVKASDGNPCAELRPPRAVAAAAGYLRVSATFDCGAEPPATISLDTFFAVAPGHVHYARLHAHGDRGGEYLFTDSRREHTLLTARSRTDDFHSAFLQYLVLGVEHILGGLDHLAFLAALLLLVSRFRELVWMVTGFTIGHSITLCLSVTGLVAVQSWIIEALIGFTIALVAADNVGVATGRRRHVALVIAAVLVILGGVSAVFHLGLPLLTLAGLALFSVACIACSEASAGAWRMRAVLTLAFGLVHGFGFANVLSDIGLPDSRLAAALAGFNIGVEIGQVAVVGVLWWVIRLLGRRSPGGDCQPWLDTASAGLCGLGVFWFVSRGFAQV